MSQKSFLDNKKSRTTNIWKIPYVSSFLFLKASLTLQTLLDVKLLLQLKILSMIKIFTNGRSYRPNVSNEERKNIVYYQDVY